jgi:diguanylate cyclase (GGDEF)-like protein
MSSSLRKPFGGYFAVRKDPYAGGDLDNANRLGGLAWALVFALTLILWPLSPPNHPLGGAGWIPAVAIAAAIAGAAVAMRRRMLGSWEALLVVAYATLLGIAVMQWLSGGIGAPYERLILLPIGVVAAIQPSRRMAPFLGFGLLVLAAPFAYDGWDADAAAAAFATFVIWCALAVIVNILMTGIRAQRLAHAEEEAEAREEARVDSLTGLHNRRAFDEMLEVEVKRARRLDVPLSMGMVDIENFKEINDRWSYLEGDRALRDVATTVRSSLRDPDLCFRWGGDEFAVILSGTTAADATSLGERLRNEVGAACRRPDQEPIRVRFAVVELRDSMPIEELVEMAGLALTAAKVGGER